MLLCERTYIFKFLIKIFLFTFLRYVEYLWCIQNETFDVKKNLRRVSAKIENIYF